jgi:hypothetical protein
MPFRVAIGPLSHHSAAFVRARLWTCTPARITPSSPAFANPARITRTTSAHHDGLTTRSQRLTTTPRSAPARPALTATASIATSTTPRPAPPAAQHDGLSTTPRPAPPAAQHDGLSTTPRPAPPAAQHDGLSTTASITSTTPPLTTRPQQRSAFPPLTGQTASASPRRPRSPPARRPRPAHHDGQRSPPGHSPLADAGKVWSVSALLSRS